MKERLHYWIYVHTKTGANKSNCSGTKPFKSWYPQSFPQHLILVACNYPVI